MAIIKRFIPLRDVKEGDLLLHYDGIEEEVKNIKFVPSSEDVYNLEVSGNHNYYAEDVLVHNKFRGKYAGSDEAAEEKLADIRGWKAAKTSINELNKQAEAIMGQQETLADLYQQKVAGQAQEYMAQQGAAQFQAGKTGMVSGGGMQAVAAGQEMFESDIAAGQTQQQTEKAGTEQQLFDISGQQSGIYATYVSGMQSTEGAPKFATSYEGGAEWSDPTIGGSGISKPKEVEPWYRCFPSDTKVDGKEISKIEVGDMVSSYNEETEVVEKAEVIEKFRHKHEKGYLVINGRIKATDNHPFYIKRYV